jgi:autotransporter-associated beta strand protein
MAASITIDSVSPFGSDPNAISGRVTGVDFSQYVVAPYIQVEGAGWWTKPFDTAPTVNINLDGTWHVPDVATGGLDRLATVIAVAVYPKTLTFPITSGGRGVPDYGYTAIAFKERWGTTIDWQGYTWAVKTSDSTPVGPGSNRFVSTPDAVWKDANDKIHLTVKPIVSPTTWDKGYGSEIIQTQPLGYGKYSFEIENSLDDLPASVTVAAFLWDCRGSSAVNANREIDIEYSTWGVPTDPNAQFVVQPWDSAGNRHRLTVPSGTLKNTIDWRPSAIQFTIARQDGTVVDTWTYSGNDIPDPGHTQFRFNSWINSIATEYPTQNLDIALKSFSFVPMPTMIWKGGANGAPLSWPDERNWTAAADSPVPGRGLKVVLGSPGCQLVLGVCLLDLSGATRTLGDMEMEGYASTKIQGSGSIVFDNGSSSTAFLNVNAGASVQNNEIVPAVALTSDLQITIASNADQLLFSGPISGLGALKVSGSGKVILGGTNTYSGGTVVNGGVLQVGSANGLLSGNDVTVGAGGTLLLDIGASNSINLGRIDGTGDMTIATGSLAVDSICQDTLTIGAGASVVIRPTGAGQASEVPEPGTIALLVTGCLCLLTVFSRRRKG